MVDLQLHESINTGRACPSERGALAWTIRRWSHRVTRSLTPGDTSLYIIQEDIVVCIADASVYRDFKALEASCSRIRDVFMIIDHADCRSSLFDFRFPDRFQLRFPDRDQRNRSPKMLIAIVRGGIESR